ncbi:hypothetical protein [Actinacidiphila oryziradicis]|uniref:Uncharacterized protein n=1 Tax=Actinacidiphila oryziradicis TaxID=2571141 RepID=A0A4U0SYQ1_9ACTN|nr:hypothetical protein [Actinacidiphila oryziradicis]TKA13197.1 hypothetical protein FCI23_00170 [Actinacidiphila oryziradicis]
MPETNPEQVECLHEIYDPNWDEPFEGYAIRRHRITKKTPKRIFYTDDWGRTYSLDRQRLEADGEIWDRVHNRRLYLREPELPQPPKRPSVAELKQRMADAHPDRGGNDAEFIAARQKYERARRMAAR